MKQIRARRSLAVALAALLALGAAGLTTGCQPRRTWSWRLGVTHGVIVEATAGRASLGIYRDPTDGLYALYRWGGIRKAQDAIWKVGEPPVVTRTFWYRGRSITTSFGTYRLRSATHSLIYDHSSDMQRALIDAHSARNCLALTLVSYGRPTSNWTHKRVGCQKGAIG